MTTKAQFDSNTAQNSKSATTGTAAQNATTADQKKHMPCKNSLPT